MVKIFSNWLRYVKIKLDIPEKSSIKKSPLLARSRSRSRSSSGSRSRSSLKSSVKRTKSEQIN